MEDDEFTIFFIALVVSIVSYVAYAPYRTARLAVRDPATIGVVRLAVFLTLAWLVYVLNFQADPSVTAIYKIFYFVLGYAIIRPLGAMTASIFGARWRADVIERGNMSAALYYASFLISIGMIYGGSLWGEADPDDTGDEGGWWIPVGFFLLGYIVLCVAKAFFASRERELSKKIQQNGDIGDGLAASTYTLSVAWVITEAVSGDFYGWGHGLLCVGAIAGMVLVHELISMLLHRFAGFRENPFGRLLENGAYLGLGAGTWFLSRQMEAGWPFSEGAG